MAGADDATIGDEERAGEAQALRELTDSLDSSAPEHDTRARLKVEGNHLQ
jgi:hypothetical protein